MSASPIVPRVPYFLVMIEEVPGHPPVDHESFIDSLVRRNLLLLGGPLLPAADDRFAAAYVLRCADHAEAVAVAATDPLYTSGAARVSVVWWDLVGINSGAMDRELELRPGAPG